MANGTAPSGLTIAADLAGISLQVLGERLSAREDIRGLRFNANEIKRESELTVRRMREEGERFESAQTTAFSKAGVILSGTPLEVMAETAGIVEDNILELEVSTRRKVAEIEAAARARRKRSGFATFATIAGGIMGGPTGAAIGSRLAGDE